jgi:hypothetical protein
VGEGTVSVEGVMEQAGEASHGLAARVFELEALAEAHHLRAAAADDAGWKAVHTTAANTYHAWSLDMQKTAARIEALNAAVARVRARILSRPPLQNGGAS